MPNFIPGLELSRRFYEEVVREMIECELGDIPYSAGLLGTGSDVLGFDTARSTDHEWGPRLFVFVPGDRASELAPVLFERLRWTLPHTFSGYPVNFGSVQSDGVRWMEETVSGPVEHKIDIRSTEGFFEWILGCATVDEFESIDWVTTSEQALLEVTAGAVFHDGIGAITHARSVLAYYPDDIWRYLLAAQWKRISQQEAFVGRTGEVGDELGSAVVGADLVRDIMRLTFMTERRYAPYAKWFGTAFAKLELAPGLTALVRRALAAENWRDREAALSPAYRLIATAHNRLELTEPLPVETSLYHDRPFQVIHGEAFAEAIRAGITDEAVLRLPEGVGSVDQWVDSTDVLSASERRS
ncbi:MAG: DUF4037 domain-containing protein, partial [Thermomicrobiales bacterium]